MGLGRSWGSLVLSVGGLVGGLWGRSLSLSGRSRSGSRGLRLLVWSLARLGVGHRRLDGGMVLRLAGLLLLGRRLRGAVRIVLLAPGHIRRRIVCRAVPCMVSKG